MPWLLFLARPLLALWIRLKGERTVSVVTPLQNPLEGYKVITSGGAEIEIFCREKVYRVHHRAPWYPNRRITLYHVYCNYSANTPQGLGARLREEFTITPLLPWGSSRVEQKKAAIDCYVSLILHHIRADAGLAA